MFLCMSQVPFTTAPLYCISYYHYYCYCWYYGFTQRVDIVCSMCYCLKLCSVFFPRLMLIAALLLYYNTPTVVYSISAHHSRRVVVLDRVAGK